MAVKNNPFILRLPEELHKSIKQLAFDLGVSMNKIIVGELKKLIDERNSKSRGIKNEK
jgi:predicted HicB family RNase H-like nuclease